MVPTSGAGSLLTLDPTRRLKDKGRGRAIYACDVGSCRRGNFAWARVGPEQPARPTSSADIEQLVLALRKDFTDGLNIALGFEAPLFVPVPDDPDDIGRARAGEGNRPFSAGAGASAALLGLQQAAWVMSRLRGGTEEYGVTTDWRPWPHPSPTILLWEAFVSGGVKGECHADDAITAAMEFHRRETSLCSDVTSELPLSLVGAAALWSGLCEDPSVLRRPVLVLRPTKRYESGLG